MRDPSTGRALPRTADPLKPFRRGLVVAIFALIALAVLAAQGCCTGHVRAEALQGPFSKIKARHDAYVLQDEALSEVEKRIHLRSTMLVEKTLKEALDPNSTKD